MFGARGQNPSKLGFCRAFAVSGPALRELVGGFPVAFAFSPRFRLGEDRVELLLRQVLDPNEHVARVAGTDQLVKLACMAAPSRFWVFWIRKTIRNVMIVVPVLMISCQVSL